MLQKAFSNELKRGVLSGIRILRGAERYPPRAQPPKMSKKFNTLCVRINGSLSRKLLTPSFGTVQASPLGQFEHAPYCGQVCAQDPNS